MLRYVETHDMREAIEQRRRMLSEFKTPTGEQVLAACDRQTLDLAASFQRAVVNDLVSKTLLAAREPTWLRRFWLPEESPPILSCERRLTKQADEQGLPVYFPSRKLSTDNAAMIAAAAYPRFLAGEFAEAELSADAGLRLR